MMNWNQLVAVQTRDGHDIEKEQKSCMIVVMDACLPYLVFGESSIPARVLINYQNQNENLIQFGLKGHLTGSHFNSALEQGNVLVRKPRDLQHRSQPHNPF